MKYKLVRKTSSAKTVATRAAHSEIKSTATTRDDSAKIVVEEPYDDGDDIRDEVVGGVAADAAVSTTAATSRSGGEQNERDSNNDQGQELYVDPATEAAGTATMRLRSWIPPRPRMPVVIPTTRSQPRPPKTNMKKIKTATRPVVSPEHPKRTIEEEGTEKIVPLNDSNQQRPVPPTSSSTSSRSLLLSSSNIHRKKITSSQKNKEQRSPLLDAVMVECFEDDETIILDDLEKIAREEDGQPQFQDTEEQIEEVHVDDQSLELAGDVPVDRQRSAGTETDGEGEYYSGSEYYSDNDDDEYDYDDDYVEDEYDNDDYDDDEEEEEPKNGWFGNGFEFGGMMVGAGVAGGVAAVAVNESKNGNHRSRSHLSSTTGRHRGVAPRDTNGLAEVESPNSMEPLFFAPVKDQSDNEIEDNNYTELQEKPDDAKEIGLDDYKKQQRLDTRQKWMQFLTLQGRLPMRRSTATWNRNTKDQHKRQLEVIEEECEESDNSATDDPDYASTVKSSVDTTSGIAQIQRRKWRPLLALKMAGASIQRRFQMKNRNKQTEVVTSEADIRSDYFDDDDENLTVYSKDLTAAPVKTEDNVWGDWLSFWMTPCSA